MNKGDERARTDSTAEARREGRTGAQPRLRPKEKTETGIVWPPGYREGGSAGEGGRHGAGQHPPSIHPPSPPPPTPPPPRAAAQQSAW